MFQNPCCVCGRRGLWFVPVEILPLCRAMLQGARCGFVSTEQPIFNPRVTYQDWSYLRRKTRRKGSKESEMTRSQVRGIARVCSVSLSWNAVSLGLISSLTSERVCLNLLIVIIPRDPLPSWHIGVTENSIARQRSSLKLLSPELLFGFSYIGGIDNISSSLPSLDVGLISPLGSKPQTSSHFVGFCEMPSLTTWVSPLLNQGPHKSSC